MHSFRRESFSICIFLSSKIYAKTQTRRNEDLSLVLFLYLIYIPSPKLSWSLFLFQAACALWFLLIVIWTSLRQSSPCPLEQWCTTSVFQVISWRVQNYWNACIASYGLMCHLGAWTWKVNGKLLWCYKWPDTAILGQSDLCKDTWSSQS